MADYVPSDDLGFSAELTTFNTRLPNYSTLFGLTAVEVAASNADAVFFKYIVDNMISHENRYHDWVSYKKLARKAVGIDILGAAPTPLTISAPPATVTAGIENRFRILVQRIKKHGAYNSSIGEDLGIEAPISALILDVKKPVLKIKLVAARPRIDWKKDGIDALEIYGSDDNTSGNYSLLATIMGTSYLDSRPLPPLGESKLRKYKAIYRHKDEQIGNWSDEVSISVTGV